MKPKFFILTAIAALLLGACEKDHDEAAAIQERTLTPEEIDILDGLAQAEEFDPSTIMLPNGEIMSDFRADDEDLFNRSFTGRSSSGLYDNLGPQEARSTMIKAMAKKGMVLTDRSLYRENGQYGLAYSWGQKNYKILQSPPGTNPPALCTDPVYGLDCSGFMYQMFLNAGVTLDLNVANAQWIRTPQNLQAAIGNAIPQLNKIKVVDIGKNIPAGNLQTGDIIYWLDKNFAYHIGMLLEDAAGNQAIFESHGSRGNVKSPPGRNGCTTTSCECNDNRSPNRGPNKLRLDQINMFGTPYGVVRINADISGTWQFKMRCAGNNPDFIVHTLEFPETIEPHFILNKDYIDPGDGSQDHTVFDFTYDKVANRLSCTYITTTQSSATFRRQDSFSVILQKDDTGYIAASQISVVGGSGCINEVRLQNLEKTPL